MTMLERMARGMASAGWIDSEDDLDKVWASDANFREGFLEFARLGLAAIRDPDNVHSKAIILAADCADTDIWGVGDGDGDERIGTDWGTAWTAMVDAILDCPA